MIEAKVVFDECNLICNGYEIVIRHGYEFIEYDAYKGDDLVEEFCDLEQAIQYCMEN